MGDLSTHNEELALHDGRCDVERHRPARTFFEIVPDLLEEGLEPLKVRAPLTVGDLLGFPLFGSRPNVAQINDVRYILVDPELGQ